MDEFKQAVWEHYEGHGRSMPWRDTPSFYNVLVSEIMLQQTQVQRVTPKFLEFIRAFPTVEALAVATLADVLRQWQGLGYNRRAKFLYEAAKRITRDGIPADMAALTMLPGVGYNTAAAIMNYAYNIPVPFVETNIRTVYFHHFFKGGTDIADKDVLQMVKETMPQDNPREWFWALMDYGAFLKGQGAGRLDVSKHYKKQSRFEGSVRQVRGRILKALVQGDADEAYLRGAAIMEDLYEKALDGLVKDGLIKEKGGRYYLTK